MQHTCVVTTKKASAQLTVRYFPVTQTEMRDGLPVEEKKAWPRDNQLMTKHDQVSSYIKLITGIEK